MRLRMKAVIAVAAVLVALAGFNLLVSPSALDIIRAGRMSNVEVVVTAQAPSVASPAHVS